MYRSALYPQGLFITALAYAICYTLDKYCLLRSWQTPAQLDDDLTKKSRAHIAFALYAHVVMTMVFYSGWPFDNTCPVIPHKHLGTYVLGKASIFCSAAAASAGGDPSTP